MDNVHDMFSDAVSIAWPSPLTPVKLRRRINRFVIEVVKDEDGTPLRLHLPNSGRMSELLTYDATGLAYLKVSPGRRTDGTLLLVHYHGRWVSVDAHMPNRLFARCLEYRALAPFRNFTVYRSEVTVDDTRLDFLLTSPGGTTCLVETKSCNLVEDGIALFPDAPTLRGTRHLDLLSAHLGPDRRCAVVWFVQRDDAHCLQPHRRADPGFAAALARAVAAGVEAYAYRCQVTPTAITPLARIPVIP